MDAGWVNAGLLCAIIALLVYMGDMLKTFMGNMMTEIRELRKDATAHRDHDDVRFQDLGQRVTDLGG